VSKLSTEISGNDIGGGIARLGALYKPTGITITMTKISLALLGHTVRVETWGK
jgi:hypothetical protein